MRIMLRKSVVDEICWYWGFPLVRKSNPMNAGTVLPSARAVLTRARVSKTNTGLNTSSSARLKHKAVISCSLHIQRLNTKNATILPLAKSLRIN